ncbi:MAG: VCBS repeat-containing protein, partial [Planctomycetota bacterium]|nr:VCBS repeat-containing protein [Planctomycetota bacterium]
HARGNSLFKNMGDGSFKDVALESNTTMGRWAWGSIFFDFNNDSLLDIFVPNGFTTNDQQDDL